MPHCESKLADQHTNTLAGLSLLDSSKSVFGKQACWQTDRQTHSVTHTHTYTHTQTHTQRERHTHRPFHWWGIWQSKTVETFATVVPVSSEILWHHQACSLQNSLEPRPSTTQYTSREIYPSSEYYTIHQQTGMLTRTNFRIQGQGLTSLPAGLSINSVLVSK